MAFVRTRSIQTRNIGSSNVLARAVGDAYAVDGFEPELAFDFTGETYRTDGSATTFSGAMTHSATSLGTMVDEDGAIKWRPHNLLTYSEDFGNAAWTKINGSVTLTNAVAAPDGTMTADQFTSSAAFGTVQQTLNLVNVKHRFSVWIKAGTSTSDWSLYDESSGVTIATITPTSEWQLLSGEWTPSTASSLCRITDRDNSNTGSIYIWGAHIYRSDLGGMVDNPDRGDSYVPTTSAAVYLPRRGHYVYNGQEWTNRGLLLESEARTNLVTDSNDFGAASWTATALTVTANDATSPDGTTNATKLTSSGSGVNRIIDTFSALTGPTTYSVYAKAGTGSYIQLLDGADAGSYANFDLTNGAVGTVGGVTTASIEDVGNGWYRCVATYSVAGINMNIYIVDSSSSTYGQSSSSADTIYIYGAQAEDTVSTASSYMPTNGATFTRAAETLTVAAADLPSTISPSGSKAALVTAGWTITDGGAV